MKRTLLMPAVALLPLPAGAVTIDFTTPVDGTTDRIEITAGGITVVITGGNVPDFGETENPIPTLQAGAVITRNATGLGVVSGDASTDPNSMADPDAQINGSTDALAPGINDYLLFEFSEPVRLMNLGIGFADSSDDLAFFGLDENGDPFGTNLRLDGDTAVDFDPSTGVATLLTTFPLASALGIAAGIPNFATGGGGETDFVSIRSIQFADADAVVPLPPSLLMLLAGLGGLGLLARRRAG